MENTHLEGTKRMSTTLDSQPASMLTDLLETYLSERECSPRYRESMQRTIRKAGAYGLKNVCQLESQAVNKFLATIPLSAVTRANIRRELLTLWRWAFEMGFTDEAPLRVLRVKVPGKPPRAWSPADLEKMLTAAERDQSVVNRLYPLVKRCDVLPAWVTVGYDSGLRFSDVLELRAESFANQCVVATANKTRKVTIRRLSPYAWEAAHRLLERSPDGTLFQWVLPRRRAILLWRDFLRGLGMSGSSKFLRRSAATLLEIDHPGWATRFLSHSNPTLAPRHYIDATLALTIPPGPPPIR